MCLCIGIAGCHKATFIVFIFLAIFVDFRFAPTLTHTQKRSFEKEAFAFSDMHAHALLILDSAEVIDRELDLGIFDTGDEFFSIGAIDFCKRANLFRWQGIYCAD